MGSGAVAVFVRAALFSDIDSLPLPRMNGETLRGEDCDAVISNDCSHGFGG
jgi:hypothetical protein